jgi:hypothetical protein
MSESCGPRKYSHQEDAEFIYVWARAFPQTLSANVETLHTVLAIPLVFPSSPVQGLLIVPPWSKSTPTTKPTAGRPLRHAGEWRPRECCVHGLNEDAPVTLDHINTNTQVLQKIIRAWMLLNVRRPCMHCVCSDAGPRSKITLIRG